MDIVDTLRTATIEDIDRALERSSLPQFPMDSFELLQFYHSMLNVMLEAHPRSTRQDRPLH